MGQIVRLLAGDSFWPWERQMPPALQSTEQVEFLIGVDAVASDGRTEDWVVVFEDIPHAWARPHPRHKTIFFCGEPPSVRRYDRAFLSQFGTVVTTDPSIQHRNVIVSQTALPWHVGVDMTSDRSHPVLGYDDFLTSPPKTKLCSVITSNKVMTREHAQRYAFVEKLKAAFSQQIDFFGRGVREIKDKDEALREYRFHIALENNSINHYWTEKLSDPILRECYPIYWGAPNIGEYFDPRAMAVIDISDETRAIEAVGELLYSSIDLQRTSELQSAKRTLLERYNIFPVICDLIESVNMASDGVLSVLRAPAPPSLFERAASRISRLASGGKSS